jgi:hypothetical protein
MMAGIVGAQAMNEKFARELDELSRAFRGGGAIPTEFQTGWVLVLLCSLALCSLAAWIAVAIVRRDQQRHGPALRRLASGMALSRHQRRLAARLATISDHRYPATVLVSQSCFERAAEQYLAQRPYAGNAVAALRVAVFE